MTRHWSGRTVKLFKAALGDRNVIPISPITASEDFSDFINQGVPSMFYTWACTTPEGGRGQSARRQAAALQSLTLLRPEPEPTFKTGVETMTLAVMNVMQ
jgi:hippurate hydrolase